MYSHPLPVKAQTIQLSDKRLTNSVLEKKNISTIPVKITDQYIENSERLAHILNSVLVMFGYNYLRDARLQQTYQLDKELHEIILMTEGIPFEIGLYGPQFWFDQNGQAKISELNSKKSIDSYVQSCKLKGLESDDSETKGCISKILDRYDTEETLFVIRDYNDSELITELEGYGMKTKDVQISDFEMKDGKLLVDQEEARQFYLDVDRELLKTFDKEVLKKIINSGRCINDVRTLILIQDRRTLAILFNQEIMGSYVNMDDHKFLSQFIAPQYTIQTKEDQQMLLNSEENWILRKNNPGSENDVFYKNETPKETWENMINKDWYLFTVQPFIPKKEYELNLENSTELAEITGFDIYFNGKSYGPGSFTSTSKSGKKSVLIPIIEKEDS